MSIYFISLTTMNYPERFVFKQFTFKHKINETLCFVYTMYLHGSCLY